MSGRAARLRPLAPSNVRSIRSTTMCLLTIHVQCVPGAPLVLAANREEYFQRPSAPPGIRGANPRILCGLDLRAGGTWLGVNEHGLVVAVTNRWGLPAPQGARQGAPSRGSLCLDLLRHRFAAEAIQHARTELDGGRYAGANYVCAERDSAYFVSNADLEVRKLEPGTHLLSNGPLDDRDDPRLALAQKLLGPEPFVDAADALARAGRMCRHVASGPGEVGIVARFVDRGTVSSTLVALTGDPAGSELWHADGPPDQVPFADYSATIRDLLARRAEATSRTNPDREA